MSAAARMNSHESAKSLLRQGDYQKSLQMLKATVENYGAHVGILADIAACHYMLDQIGLWKESVINLKAEFHKNEFLLSSDSLFRTALFIGMCDEETALADSALNYYSIAISVPEMSLEYQLKARAQRLRLSTALQMPDIFGDYAFCLSNILHSKINQSEADQALLLFEARTLGIEMAIWRWKKIKGHMTNAFNESLVYFDLLEYALEYDLTDALRLHTQGMELPKPQNQFEESLLKLQEDPNYRYDFETFDRNSKTISYFSQMRLLALAIQKNRTDHLGRGHLIVLMNALPIKDRKHLEKKWESLLNKAEPLRIFPQTGAIGNSQMMIYLPKDSLEFKALGLFLNQKKVPIEQAIQDLYSEELSETAISKLRALFKRLQKKLAPLSGSQKLFRITKNQVETNLEIGF